MKMPKDERGIPYKDLRKMTEDVAPREAERTQWPEHENGAEKFDVLFGYHEYDDYPDKRWCGFLHEPMKDVVRKRRESGMPTNALDIMGDGTLLRELGVEGGLSVCLQDTRSDDVRREDGAKGLDVLGGDLLRKRTWAEISEWMTRRNVQGFDYIVAMPFGGLVYLPKGETLVQKGIEELYKRLSPDGGRMYLQIAQNNSANPKKNTHWWLFGEGRDKTPWVPPEYGKLVPEDGSYPADRDALRTWVEGLRSRYPDLHINVSTVPRAGMALILEVIRTPESPKDLSLE